MIENIEVRYGDKAEENLLEPMTEKEAYAAKGNLPAGRYVVQAGSNSYLFSCNDFGRLIRYRYKYKGLELSGEQEILRVRLRVRLPQSSVLSAQREPLEQVSLTLREKTLVALYLQGLSDGQAGDKTGLSQPSVSQAWKKILCKLSIKRREDLLFLAHAAFLEQMREREKGLLDLLREMDAYLDITPRVTELQQIQHERLSRRVAMIKENVEKLQRKEKTPCP